MNHQEVNICFLNVINDFFSPRWADKIESPGSDGKIRKFDHPFVQACFMFAGEILCLLVFKAIFCRLRKKNVKIIIWVILKIHSDDSLIYNMRL
jgi:hypothetical protein